MYCIIFVTFNKEKANTSEEAIEYVERNIRRGTIKCRGFFPSKDLMLDIDWYRIGRGEFDYFSKDKCKVKNPNNAAILTKDLYDELLVVFERNKNEWLRDIQWSHADLEAEEVSPDFVGKKWIVVVDGHLQ